MGSEGSIGSQSDTLENFSAEHKWHVHGPFLVVTHHATDIGLVGWNDVRWKHQDKSMPPMQKVPAHMWRQAFDPQARKYYFYNAFIGTTSWSPPRGGFVPDDTVQYYVDSGLADPWPEQDVAGHAQGIGALPLGPERGEAFPIQLSSSTLQKDARHNEQEGNTEFLVTPAAVQFCPRAKGDLDPTVERYWITRYSLSSQWAHGVCFNERSLYSVTPEVLAQRHAHVLQGQVILDAFCGCGGNAVQFAQHAEKVYAFDMDSEQLAMARRNVQIYGVVDRVVLIHGDAFALAPKLRVDAVFLSPPWGGPTVPGTTSFDASSSIPGLSCVCRGVVDALRLAKRCLAGNVSDPVDQHVPNVAVFLPKTVSMSGLAIACGDAQVAPLCLERNVLNGQLKGLTLYARI